MKRALRSEGSSEEEEEGLLEGLGRTGLLAALVLPHLGVGELVALRATSRQLRAVAVPPPVWQTAAQRGLGQARLEPLAPASGVTRMQMALRLWALCHVDWAHELACAQLQSHLHFNLRRKDGGGDAAFRPCKCGRPSVFLDEESALLSEGYDERFEEVVGGDHVMEQMATFLSQCCQLPFTLPSGYRVVFSVGGGGSGIFIQSPDRKKACQLGNNDAHPQMPALRWKEAQYIARYCDDESVSEDLAPMALGSNCWPAAGGDEEDAFLGRMGHAFEKCGVMDDANVWRRQFIRCQSDWEKTEDEGWVHAGSPRRRGAAGVLQMCREAFPKDL